MANAETEYVIRMRDSLAYFEGEVSHFMREHGHQPMTGSIAANELSTFSDPELIITCWALWNYLMELGGEHVSLFRKSLTEPVEPIACFTCVRSMLESCALAAWLADPAIDARTRVGRALAHRYKGIDEQLKFGRIVGRPHAELTKTETQFDVLEKHALTLGFNKMVNSKGERIGVAERMPGPTEIIGIVLDEEHNYRMLSAIAHGHFWAIHGLCYKPSAESPALMVNSVATKGFEKVLKFEAIALMGSCVFKSITRPLWSHCQYFGWDASRLEQLIENVADKLQINDNRRFWRS